jgi:DNA-binding MarR family transcriptional regulator
MTKVSQAGAAKLWEDLSRAHAVMAAALEKDMLPEAGLPLAWFEVMMHLSRAPGGMLRFQELAKTAGITNSGASRRLDQMIKAGLLERQSCPTDRRGAFAHITERGRSSYKRAHTVYMRSLERNFGSHLESREANLLRATLSRIS